MEDRKKQIYFWLKLDNNFYKNLAIKKARKLAGGDTMIVIYQKLMLTSLDTAGVIYYEGAFGNLTEELSLLIDEETEQVGMTIAFFQKAGLIQIDDNDNVEMLQVPALLEQETNWAKYKRGQRKNKKLDNVQSKSNARPIDIDIELEKEIDINKAQSDDMRTSHQNVSNEQELKDNFDKLWKLYPNKKDKQRAFKAYKKAVKEGTANKDIQDGIVAYKKYVEQERANGFEQLNYKDGSTFFNGRNWEDEYPVNGSVSNSCQLNSIAGLTADEQQSGEFMKLVNKFYGRSDFSGNKYTLAVIRKMYAHDRHE